MDKELFKTKKFWRWFVAFFAILIVFAIISDFNKPSKCDCADIYLDYIGQGKNISKWSSCVHSYQKDIDKYLNGLNVKLMPDNGGSTVGAWESGAYDYFKTSCSNDSIVSNESKSKNAINPDVSPTQAKTDRQLCFDSGDGLKYRTKIDFTLLTDSKVNGVVEVSEIGSDSQPNKFEFAGTRKGNNIIVNFNNGKPNVGNHEEWTNAPWVLKTNNESSSLIINVDVKNDESRKWENYNSEYFQCK